MGRIADLKDFWSKTVFEETERKGYFIESDYTLYHDPFVRDSEQYHSEVALQKLQIPLGLIYGERDTNVPPSESLKVQKYAAGQIETRILPELNHVFYGEKVKQEVIGITLEWLRRWMPSE